MVIAQSGVSLCAMLLNVPLRSVQLKSNLVLRLWIQFPLNSFVNETGIYNFILVIIKMTCSQKYVYTKVQMLFIYLFISLKQQQKLCIVNKCLHGRFVHIRRTRLIQPLVFFSNYPHAALSEKCLLAFKLFKLEKLLE